MAYGTDLLAEMHRHQSGAFALRARVLPGIDVLRSATLVAAKLLRMEGKLGVIEPGALADLLVVEDDPLRDWTLLENQGSAIPVIMQGGQFIKHTLVA